MYKTISSIAFCLTLFTVSADAQTTNTFPASGNVGIGTTAPGWPLEIDSDASYNAPLIWLQNNSGSTQGAFGPGFVLDNGVSGVHGFVLDEYQDANSSFELSSLASPYTTFLAINQTGNMGVGTASPGAKLEVNGNVKLTASSGASIIFQDGTVQSTAYTGVTCGGDYAESVDVTGERKKYETGDVLVIDPKDPGKFLKSAMAYSTSVTGIYSTRPGTVGRRQLTPKSPDEVPMAMMGIVPAKVSAENGAIHPGDLLVTASTLGYAMKGTDRSRMLGAVIGKALGTLESGTGTIEVVVTLQ